MLTRLYHAACTLPVYASQLGYAGEAVEEWLVMREEADDKHSYTLYNASRETALEQLD